MNDAVSLKGGARTIECPIASVKARAYSIPTETPEADGTLSWDKTVLVLAEVEAGGEGASATPTRTRARPRS